MQADNIILTFFCPDCPGIVARVAGFFAEHHYNIEESSQYEDKGSQLFFMRTSLSPAAAKSTPTQALKTEFEEIARQYQMINWEIQPSDYRLKVLIATSKWGHCLNDLLHNWKVGSLPIDIVGVISNHEDMRDLTEWYGLPYHYLPVTSDTKQQQEQQILRLFADSQADLLVLARYMQILSDELCQKLSGKAINIHHSFLPGFKGAKPYYQAYERGVKLIGATAHYVTPDLDEGPIIEQEVERVTHAHSVEQLTEIGRDIENLVLRRAVKWHAEHRVLLNQNRTVVFKS